MQLQRELNIACCVRARDLAEQRTVTQGRVRVAEVGVVEQIEHFRAELQSQPLVDRKSFAKFTSTFWNAGPMSELRLMLPSVPNAGTANAFGSNQ